MWPAITEQHVWPAIAEQHVWPAITEQHVWPAITEQHVWFHAGHYSSRCDKYLVLQYTCFWVHNTQLFKLLRVLFPNNLLCTDFNRTWCTFSGTKYYTGRIFVTCPKVYGIALMLNQNILMFTFYCCVVNDQGPIKIRSLYEKVFEKTRSDLKSRVSWTQKSRGTPTL